MRSTIVQGMFLTISQVIIIGGLFSYVVIRIALFFLVLGSFNSFNISGFHFYIQLYFQREIQPHCPIRTRKVLLITLPAKPHTTLIAPGKKPPLRAGGDIDALKILERLRTGTFYSKNPCPQAGDPSARVSIYTATPI